MKAKACPSCKSPDQLETIENIYGYAPITINGPDFELLWEGETKINWDASETVGVWCNGCHWHFEGKKWFDELIEVEVAA